MSMKEDDPALAGLTDEERALMLEPDDDEDLTATVGDLEDKGQPVTTAKEQANADDANEDDAGTDVDAGGAGAAADDDAAQAGHVEAGNAEDGAAGADEPGAAPSAPLFVAEAPADAEVKLAEIATKKAELRAQHDDGDITTDELMTQTDTLNKQERDIERAIDRAELAASMEQQRLANEWLTTANKFAADHGYDAKGNPRQYRALDAEVRDIAVTPEGQKMTGPQILAAAHANLVAAGMAPAKAAVAAPVKKTAIPRPNLPPDLGAFPASGGNDPGEGRFASLDRLQQSNPAAYEAAIAKLPQAELDAYLST